MPNEEPMTDFDQRTSFDRMMDDVIDKKLHRDWDDLAIERMCDPDYDPLEG